MSRFNAIEEAVANANAHLNNVSLPNYSEMLAAVLTASAALNQPATFPVDIALARRVLADIIGRVTI